MTHTDLPTCGCNYCCTKPGFVDIMGANRKLKANKDKEAQEPEKKEDS